MVHNYEYEDEINGFKLVKNEKLDSNGEKQNIYWDNHHTFDVELELLNTWVKCLKDIFNNDAQGFDDNEIEKREKELSITLPLDIKLVYANFGKDDKFLKDRHNKRYFLPLDKLYVAGDNLAYKKQGRKYIWGIDLGKNRGTYYLNDEWLWNKADMPLYKTIITNLFVMRLSNMANVVYSRFSVKSTIKLDGEATEKFADYLSPVSNFDWYGHMLFYNKEMKALAWVCPLNSQADILIGCDDLSFIERFIDNFELSPKYRVKNNEITK